MNELVTKPTSDLLGFIERAAKDPTFDVNKFSILLDRQQALLREHRLMQFNAAFARMQNEIGAIIKTGKNPIFKNPYARLEDLDDAVRPVCSANGFSIRYTTNENWKDGWLLVILTLAHEGGHSETTSLPGPYDMMPPGSSGRGPARSPIQAIGSTVSYLRRYTLQMALNLVPKNDPADDDGRRTQREYLEHRDEVKSDATADSIIEDIQACKSHTELHVYKQQHIEPIWGKLFPPDRQRIEREYKTLMEKFRDEGDAA